MALLIECTEGEPFYAEPALREPIRFAARRVYSQLRPRFRVLHENGGLFTLSGVVGTIAAGTSGQIQINPKIASNEDWIHSVLDLLVGADRIDASGERAAGLSQQRRSLLEVLAAIYAARLQRALRRDGPITMIHRTSARLPYLKGKLRVTPWVRHATHAPHRFPVSFDHLTPDNDFSQGLSAVALSLSEVTQSTRVRSTLIACARSLRPGFGPHVNIQPGLERRRLPSQWALYGPAWSIAAAVLAQRSLLHPRGIHTGVSIVIEAWPLLERLLERSLISAVHLASERGHAFELAPKTASTLLSAPSGVASGTRRVIPDGRLTAQACTVATFEAKYKRRDNDENWPAREDVFQALCTAAACDSPLAVLVYPGSFPTGWWRVTGFNGTPTHLAVIGIGLYSYRAGDGDTERGERIVDLLQGPGKHVDQLDLRFA